jgi:hypothetical protein
MNTPIAPRRGVPTGTAAQKALVHSLTVERLGQLPQPDLELRWSRRQSPKLRADDTATATQVPRVDACCRAASMSLKRAQSLSPVVGPATVDAGD